MALGVVSEILMLAGILGVLLTVILLLEVAEARATVSKRDEPQEDGLSTGAETQTHTSP